VLELDSGITESGSGSDLVADGKVEVPAVVSTPPAPAVPSSITQSLPAVSATQQPVPVQLEDMDMPPLEDVDSDSDHKEDVPTNYVPQLATQSSRLRNFWQSVQTQGPALPAKSNPLSVSASGGEKASTAPPTKATDVPKAVSRYDLRERKVKEPVHPWAMHWKLPVQPTTTGNDALPQTNDALLGSGSSCAGASSGRPASESTSHVSNQNYARLLDDEDKALPALMIYRANAPPLPAGDTHLKGVVGNDPATKPISVGPPKNRKEALASPWWDGYYNAEKIEMASHEKNGTWC
jgi:hypothetical protein